MEELSQVLGGGHWVLWGRTQSGRNGEISDKCHPFPNFAQSQSCAVLPFFPNSSETPQQTRTSFIFQQEVE